MLLEKNIDQLSEGIQKKEFSTEEIVAACYDNIEKYAGKINAFITLVDKETALKAAREKDKQKTSRKSKLQGIPFVLKDAYITKGIKTTSASNVLRDYMPQYSSTVYTKLIDAGAILLGKMNMDAWGHGGSSENTDFGPVHNPWELSRVAGGSSGGPAAALACRMAIFAIGEDTGGSIRNPAAWCNISGLKVTYGRVSRYGTIAYASSFDSVGPMAKTASDCASVLEVIAGKDSYDATSSPKEVPFYSKELSQPIKGIKIGLPKQCFATGLDKEIKESIYLAADKLQEIGIEIEEISMPMFDYGIPVYYLIGPSETSSNLARYDGIRFGAGRENFTDETMRRIMVGTYALSTGYYDAFYKKAQQARTLFIKEYEKALHRVDVLLMPINPTPPTKIGELISNPLQNLLADVYTTSQNPVGVPSLAIPCGFSRGNLPVGMQLIGKMFSESLLLRIGHAYQQITDWHTRKPAIGDNI